MVRGANDIVVVGGGEPEPRSDPGGRVDHVHLASSRGELGS